MTATQIVQALTSPLALLIITTIAGIWARPWMLAHKAQIDQTTAAITDSRLRAAAESIVRWLEQDPQQAQLPGLVQRTNGITALADQMGIPLGEAGPLIDDAFNLLSAAGQVVMAPPPPAAVPALAPPTLQALAAAVLAQLTAAATTPDGVSVPPGASSGPPAPSPLPVPLPDAEALVGT